MSTVGFRRGARPSIAIVTRVFVGLVGVLLTLSATEARGTAVGATGVQASGDAITDSTAPQGTDDPSNSPGQAPEQTDYSPAPASIEVSQLPSNVTLASGDHATITLVITNSTESPVRFDGLRVNAPSVIGIEDAALVGTPTIEAGSRFTKEFRILGGSAPGSAVVTSVVTVSDPSTPTATWQIETATEVTIVRTFPTLEVSVVSAPTSISDGQTGAPLVVVVGNPSPYPLAGLRIEYVDSNDLQLRARSGDMCSTSDEGRFSATPTPSVEAIGAGQSVTVQLCVDADDLVRAEKQTVGVVVSGVFDTPGVSTPVSATTTSTIDVTVLGMAFLGALGAVGILLFPPIVALVVFLSFSRLVYPRASWLPQKVEVTELGKLVWLVPAAAVVYWIFWLVRGDDLTRETSTHAIVVLYGLSMIVGLVAWAGFAVGYNRRTGRKRFRPGDTPGKVLERLAAAGTPLVLPTSRLDGMPVRYILGLGPQGEVAICSRIEFSYVPADQASTDAVNDAINTDDPGKVRTKLRRAQLGWTSTGVQLVQTATPSTPDRVIGEKA